MPYKTLFAAVALSAISTSALALEDAPEISDSRWDSIELCINKMNQEIRDVDPREETTHGFYFENIENYEAVGVALTYGDYDEHIRSLSIAGEMSSYLMFDTQEDIMRDCALYSDSNGDLPQDVKDGLHDRANAFFKYDMVMLGILKELRDAGQEMIENDGIDPHNMDRPPKRAFDIVEP